MLRFHCHRDFDDDRKFIKNVVLLYFQSRLASNRTKESDLEEQISRMHTKTAQLPVFECDAMLREEILDIKFNIDKSEKDISTATAFSP